MRRRERISAEAGVACRNDEMTDRWILQAVMMGCYRVS